MKIGSCIASLGHFSFMAGITFSIKIFLLTSLLTEVMGFVTRVPATLLTLVLFAGS
jgi:hypothetical protein